ncbi:DUF6518 family protein [Curtobacterium sp. MCBD17_019]|uniref:DUF6518 family protein n=1 Tax=Curtobacterium sp. MCBD17_019 TaxID=2175669 RepID=UPI000DAAD098|nr:DUF6518 family protein [Curtobacterium sp. MCBD17_019]PZE78381.1 hypothetical protein DEI82_01000 [Curtobacterium sp. MCBD17_019]
MEAPVLPRRVVVPPRSGALPRPAGVVVALAGALLVGMLTSIGQSGSAFVATLSNAAGPWFVAAVLLVLVVRPGARWAAALGVVCLELMHVGYWAATVLAGRPDALSPFGTWELLGVPAGVLAALVAVGVVSRDGRVRGAAAGVVGAVLVGEGIRGLLVVAATTSSTAWTSEVVGGVLCVVAAVVAGRSPIGRVVALGTGVVGAAGVLGALLVV